MKNLLLLFLFPFLLFAQGNSQKKLVLYKASTPIKIDGVIDPVWNTADSATNFFQLQPYYNKTPDYKTVAKVLTTNNALYCLIKCYEPKEMIQTNTGMLDLVSGDLVSIMLDTFDDKKTAYKFGVSASGVKNDSRMLDDARNRDYAWDGIWFSDAKIYNWGYVVEMKIPYKSIQYDEKLSYWGIDFDRWIPSLSEDLYWCSYDHAAGQRISQFASLEFNNFHPSVKGLNLEIYPVGLTKVEYLHDNKYKLKPSAGVDVFYNPSPKLKFQLTANPDFAQIEADPYDFNISRYESYFSERRPFFTEGSEVFTASGKERNTGFYKPLELFYSRRIGKKLPDGSEVPLYVGAKAFGRINETEYGGFLAMTGAKDYVEDSVKKTEEKAYFGLARLKTQIWGNSTLGGMFVGKQTKDNNYGVLDIDGALRQSNWQLSYQLARSFKNSEGDFAGSAGFVNFGKTWINFIRGKYIGSNFDIEQIGYVPWIGTWELTGISGPVWLPEDGYIRQILLYGGVSLNHKNVELYTDRSALLGFNMQFRDNWGYEINISAGRSKDEDILYDSYEIDLNSWYNISPKWSGNFFGGYSKTYNFNRDYLAFYTWTGIDFSWNASDILEVGTTLNAWVEGNPDGNIEDITYNARPYFSLTPFNDLNIRLYVDNTFDRSSMQMQRIAAGFLFSYNFSPKSWIYLAINESHDRSDSYNSMGQLVTNQMHLVDRVGVFKIKYLYYF